MATAALGESLSEPIVDEKPVDEKPIVDEVVSDESSPPLAVSSTTIGELDIMAQLNLLTKRVEKLELGTRYNFESNKRDEQALLALVPSKSGRSYLPSSRGIFSLYRKR